ncbi:MAG: LysR family transcriptional regulator [Cryobacterium sp.]|nr:LysR family transcriptional regulator [Oligoflexia bacterium]
MNLDQLEAIDLIAQLGSFRAAAAKLKRSQPALSAAIKNLEAEFGILIFDRSAYRPKLTEAGAIFLSAARTTLNAAKQASRIAGGRSFLSG